MGASAWIRIAPAAALASLLLLASSAEAESAIDAPSSVEEAERVYPPPSTRYKLIGAGALTTGAWYGAAAGMSFAFPDAPGAKDLRIPVAGPWLAIANNGCPPNEPDCSRVWVITRTILTALDGIGQAAGIGLILEGLFLPTQEPSAGAPAKPRPAPSIEPEEPGIPEPSGPLFYMPAPTVVGTSGVGVTWGGVF